MEPRIYFNDGNKIRILKIFQFILPTYFTSFFNTLYTIVDGIFVATFVGTLSLAAINIVYPIINILTGIALIFATGGSAISAMYIGGKNLIEANRSFTMSILFSMIFGFIFSLVVIIFLPEVLSFLGATQNTYNECKTYVLWWLIGSPIVIGKELLTYFIRIDGSPTYSLLLSVSGGVLNIILDYIFIAQFKMGIIGASLATLLGLLLSFLLGVIYFSIKSNYLKINLKNISFKVAFRCMVNGISEFIDQISIAITTVVFNLTVLGFAKETGVAAVSVVMYLQYLFIGVYFGYSMGISPLLSYAYGHKDTNPCKKFEIFSYKFLLFASILACILTNILAPVLVLLFTEKNSSIYFLSLNGLRLFSLSFLFSGINIFSAVRLMSYGKGHLSGIITISRSFVLLLLFLFILPKYLGINGVWLAVPLSEFFTLFISITLNKISSTQN